MSHTVPKRRDGDADDLSVDLSVGIDDRRQVTLDQHHGLSPRRSKTMSRLEPAPFPTECAPHIAAPHANPQNARVYTPDRPVSSKSRRPRKAERGVRVIARDPECWRSLSSMHQRAYSKCPQGRDGQKTSFRGGTSTRSAWTSRTSARDPEEKVFWCDSRHSTKHGVAEPYGRAVERC
jgi:hypothetical protein